MAEQTHATTVGPVNPSALPRLPGIPRGARGPASLLLGFGGLGTIVLLIALGVAVIRLTEAQIRREAIPALTDKQFDVASALPDDGANSEVVLPITGRRNVLVVGLDTREGLTAAQLLALGTEAVGESLLTDTILVVQYSADDDRARILSFPRDLAIPQNGGFVKINSLRASGGPTRLVEEVEALVGIDLDHYVEVDIAGFLRLTDAIGGVEVCLEQPLKDRFAGADLPAGCQVLDGIDAAGFVRARRASDSFGVDDYGRAARQQYFIKQAVSEILTAGTLTNPSRISALMGVARQSVVTDQNLTTREILRLATTARAFDPETLQTATVPGGTEIIRGISFEVMRPEAQELFTAMQRGTPFPAELVQAQPAG